MKKTLYNFNSKGNINQRYLTVGDLKKSLEKIDSSHMILLSDKTDFYIIEEIVMDIETEENQTNILIRMGREY